MKHFAALPLSFLLLAVVAMPAAAETFFVVTPIPGKSVSSAPEPISVSLSGSNLPKGLLRQAYSHDFRNSLSVRGDPEYTGAGVTFTSTGQLPAGMTLSSDGLLSGTPTSVAAARDLEIEALYKDKSARQTYSLMVDQTKLRASKISSGGNSGCAIDAQGALVCWGGNAVGQVGNGTVGGTYLTPTAVTGMGSGVTAVSVGTLAVCAIKTGTFYCWSYRAAGTQPQGAMVSTPLALTAQGMGTATHIAAGSDYACGIAGGRAYCWGTNSSGRLGNSSVSSSTVPTEVMSQDSNATDIDVGANHACLITNGGLKCWGSNRDGQVGAPGTGIYYPLSVPGLTSGVTGLAVGSNFTCAIQNGALLCFGSNLNGQLGRGTASTNFENVPTVVPGFASGVTHVVAGDEHVCAVKGGEAYCWGRNLEGVLGNGSLERSQVTSPARVVGLGPVSDIATGFNTVCVLESGLAKCWGFGNQGQLGNGVAESRGTPDFVAEPGSP